jgi:hypothetical protein
MAIYFTKSNESNIREINQSLSQGQFTSFLHQIKLNKIRGFENQTVNFEFPVTAIVAPNGGGKTTILAAACLPYMDIEPSVFIQHSRSLDQSMHGWNLEFDITTSQMIPQNAKPTIPDTNRFSTKLTFRTSPKLGWNRRQTNQPYRLPEPKGEDKRLSVVVLGIGRTIAAIEKPEFAKFVDADFSGTTRANIGGARSAQVLSYVNTILGKSVIGYQSLDIPRGKVSKITGRSDQFFTGVTPGGSAFSEFHFGAGESSVIRMVTAIENARDGALVLIEEIENGLHPLAARRMVEYLIDATNRKKLQILFTTHSNEALLPLPANAVCSIVNWQIYQHGKISVDLLREMRGETDKRLFVYVEDRFAKHWLDTVIYHHVGVNSDTVEVYAISGDFIGHGGGAGDIPKMVAFHRRIPTPIKDIPAIGYIDGKTDGIRPDPSKHVYQLPGGDALDPEAYIVSSVLAQVDKIDTILGCQSSQKAEFVAAITQTQLATGDAHNLFLNIAERFNRSQREVEVDFLRNWIYLYPELVGEIVTVIDQYLKANNDVSPA